MYNSRGGYTVPLLALIVARRDLQPDARSEKKYRSLQKQRTALLDILLRKSYDRALRVLGYGLCCSVWCLKDQRSGAPGFGFSGTPRRTTPWCFVGNNGGMDPYGSPYIFPNNSPHNPFPHSLLSTKETVKIRVVG